MEKLAGGSQIVLYLRLGKGQRSIRTLRELGIEYPKAGWLVLRLSLTPIPSGLRLAYSILHRLKKKEPSTGFTVYSDDVLFRGTKTEASSQGDGIYATVRPMAWVGKDEHTEADKKLRRHADMVRWAEEAEDGY